MSSLDLTPTSSGIQARLSLSPRDAELAARIDADGKLTADEWTIAVPRLEAFARETIDVRIGDRRLTGSIDDVGLEGDATVFVGVRFAVPGPYRQPMAYGTAVRPDPRLWVRRRAP